MRCVCAPCAEPDPRVWHAGGPAGVSSALPAVVVPGAWPLTLCKHGTVASNAARSCGRRAPLCPQSADAYDQWRRDAIRGVATRTAHFSFRPSEVVRDAKAFLAAKVPPTRAWRFLLAVVLVASNWDGVHARGASAAATRIHGSDRRALYATRVLRGVPGSRTHGRMLVHEIEQAWPLAMPTSMVASASSPVHAPHVYPPAFI